MARERKDGQGAQSEKFAPAPRLAEPFETIFAKMFDADERMVWLAKCKPCYDRDMKTILLHPQNLWGYDWILRNFNTRLTQCCAWKLVHPVNGTIYDETDKPDANDVPVEEYIRRAMEGLRAA